MKTVVITGGTRGIGRGLARSFLARDARVVISGRTQESLDAGLQALREAFPGSQLIGAICDVRKPEQLQALWDTAQDKFGIIDIWVNNAGISGDEAALWEMPPAEVAAVIETNVLGTIYGCQTAVQGMLLQDAGAIYNMEGMGSDGRIHNGLTSYGSSKYAIHYITTALAKELGDTPLIIGSLRPGMVVTALLSEPYRDRPEEFERVKRIFNIIAEKIETVSPWLVDRMLANTKSGVVLSYASRFRLLWRFLTAPFVKRDLFGDD
jgi:NAD(P)-dependent dehydrogenase (short-subunit alcohol dehydrogenase family)